MLKRSRCVLSNVRLSKRWGGRRVLATPDKGCISRNHLGREAACAQMHSQLRQVPLMCNSKCNRRSTPSLPARLLIRPMTQNPNPREENLSKRINWVKIRTLWRINEILLCQTAKNSQMLEVVEGHNPQDKISSPLFTVGAIRMAQGLKALAWWVKDRCWGSLRPLIILPWTALCQVTWLQLCITKFPKAIEAPSTAMTLIWLL